ncbi:MAG: hypothetical protein LBJ10_02570, partial [Clostridiales bacterium]|nr:hypothetical protein [Clostridiales bacterium]
MARKYFTSESVTEGHPDKVCDQISDAVLDALLKEDPGARVACETAATTGFVFVMGEITTAVYADIPKIVRVTVNEIGYSDPSSGFDGNTCAVVTSIDEQSADIALGVDEAYEIKAGGKGGRGVGAGPAAAGGAGSGGGGGGGGGGDGDGDGDDLGLIGAGDQGIMFGYACDETPEYMPAPIQFAHDVCRRLAAARKSGELKFLRPDGKSQVTVAYEGGKP